MLSLREERILKSIVGQYITTAVPVSSQRVTEECGLRVSPATIRNEMVNLEQEGYIIRPHTSAGSIPSDKAYRFYVSSLGDVKLPLEEQLMISHLFHQVEEKLEEWEKLAATLAAQLAQNMALVTRPKLATCRFGYVELVTLRDSVALVVLLLQGAKVKEQLVSLDQVVLQSELTKIAHKLNQAYSSLTNAQILARDLELSLIERKVTDCVVSMMQTEDERKYDEPCIEGLQFILSQPELVRGQHAQALLKLVEEKSLLRDIALEEPLTANQRVRVIIGRENKAEFLHGYSVVVNRYGLPELVLGTIGVIGPSRMLYARVIAAVEYLSSMLTGLVVRLYGGN